MAPRSLALALALGLGQPSANVQALPCAETPDSLVTNIGSGGCSQCANLRLPGALADSPDTSYTVLSDLPEVFCSTGVLYSTAPVLPPDPDGLRPLGVRTQTNAGFTSIDGPFDTFVFHNVYSCSPAAPDKRLVVLARNDGTSTVTVTPRQILVTDGTIGNVHQMESSIGTRELSGAWDTPVAATPIAPGATAVVAYSKRFSSTGNDSDRSTNVNCFGRVRGAVANPQAPAEPTRLTLSVVAVDGAAPSENLARATAALAQSARSGESAIDLATALAGCDIRRATGVYRTFQWRSAGAGPGGAVTLDAAALPPGGLAFQMANFDLISSACPAASQTGDMLLYPGYGRADTIGNYHVECRLRLRLINRDPASTRTVDLGFGKPDADVGLAWQAAVTPDGQPLPTDAALAARPARSGWAGPFQAAAPTTRSMLLADGGPVALGPCSAATVDLRFLVLGNASLPYQLHVEGLDGLDAVIVDNGDPGTSFTGSWPTSANAPYWGTVSLRNQGGSGADRYFWSAPLARSGLYAVYARWVAASNRAAAAPYLIAHQGGTAAVAVDQRNDGARWNHLGTWTMAAGPLGAWAQLSDAVGPAEFVSADALQWVYVGPIVAPVALTAWGAD